VTSARTGHQSHKHLGHYEGLTSGAPVDVALAGGYGRGPPCATRDGVLKKNLRIADSVRESIAAAPQGMSLMSRATVRRRTRRISVRREGCRTFPDWFTDASSVSVLASAVSGCDHCEEAARELGHVPWLPSRSSCVASGRMGIPEWCRPQPSAHPPRVWLARPHFPAGQVGFVAKPHQLQRLPPPGTKGWRSAWARH
jgi:hypothetical protein